MRTSVVFETTGRNRYLYDRVFLSWEEILDARPTMRDIRLRETINALDFGRLTIGCDGQIYANISDEPIGILAVDSLEDVVARELERGDSWRRVRRVVEPCKNCVLASLCPPLSNYERALGRNSLCHVRNSDT